VIPPGRPEDEAVRLAELRALRMLDTPRDERFDCLTRLAAQVFGTPMAFLTLVDDCLQWFKSTVGAEISETSRDVSFCGHTILDEGFLVVRDATKDERFKANPLVLGPPHIRFYAGFPVRSSKGACVGTLCVVDSVPRDPSSSQLDALRDLARLAEAELQHQRDAAFGLGPKQLAEAFPFSFVLDAELRFTTWGHSLQKLLRRDLTGVAFDEVFLIRRPSLPATFESLSASKKVLFILEGTSGGPLLRGSLTPTPLGRGLMFLGSPWVTSLMALEQHGLTLEDFALHDPATDLIQLLENHSQSIADLRRLNVALTGAKRTAEEATRASEAFLAHISHELRTPMNAVLGMCSLVLDTPLSSEQRDYVDTIRSSGENLLAVANDVLDYSKIESGKLSLEQIPFSPLRVIDECLDLVALSAARKSLELAGWCDADVPDAVLGDPARVRQIVLNLVGNAVKFTERGHVVVHVSHDASANVLSIAVEDTGIGVPPHLQSAIFQPFAQAESSTTRRFGGTGLGLTISRRLTEMMNGTLSLERSVGNGSTFLLRIPAVATGARSTMALPLGAVGRRVGVHEPSAIHARALVQRLARLGGVPVEFASEEAVLAGAASDAEINVWVIGLSGSSEEARQLVRRVRARSNVPLVVCAPAGVRAEGPRVRVVQRPAELTRLARALAEVTSTRTELEPSISPVPSVRILLVEDDVVNQKVAKLLLARIGATCDVAANGFEGIEAVSTRDYDLVLMDIQMPELDGMEATRRIRALGGRQPRIVALTANTTNAERAAAFSAGVDDFLAKPLDPAELRQAVLAADPSEPAY
jgi:signal transduction histidine kinase/CheY-like chemotaxis protein